MKKSSKIVVICDCGAMPKFVPEMPKALILLKFPKSDNHKTARAFHS
jgi:hypothetical protein